MSSWSKPTKPTARKRGSWVAGQGISLSLILALALLSVLPGLASAADDEGSAALQLADDGTGVRGLLYARPFTLEEPYRYLYVKEQPEITSGYILVLEVDPRLAQPRQTDMPVLFVGDRPAELASSGAESGRVIVLVPGDTDLAESPLFYGSMELPERIDRARGMQERDLALSSGITAPTAEEVEAALLAGGEPLGARSIDGVYRALADLILTYSPQEAELAEIYRLIPAER